VPALASMASSHAKHLFPQAVYVLCDGGGLAWEEVAAERANTGGAAPCITVLNSISHLLQVGHQLGQKSARR
jgi:hypothetical protein